MNSCRFLKTFALLILGLAAQGGFAVTTNTVRVAACQAKPRLINFRLDVDQALKQVDQNLGEFEKIVERAGDLKCDVLVLPEDTPGLLNWTGVNEANEKQLLPKANQRMLERLGQAASRKNLYLVVCSDHLEQDGGIYNTAFFLGRDGKEIGRYHKVCPAYHELLRQRGNSFPVFLTRELGSVGMLICYDLVIPETARCLALQGADIIFFPTMGGAAIGDEDLGVHALRVRAAENFIWLVVAQRGEGAMIISPQGTIVAKAQGPDGLAVADIDPFGSRAGGDAMNSQRDMRARLFRERNPAAFGILTESNPPVLGKVPIDISPQEAYHVAARVLTVGEEQFGHAAALARAGQTNDAMAAFAKLRVEYRDSWIDAAAQQKLLELRPLAAGTAAAPATATSGADPQATEKTVAALFPKGLAARYPGDDGLEQDSQVLFHENFETGSLAELGKRWTEMSNKDGEPMAFSDEVPPISGGHRSLEITATLGKNTGGHLYKRLPHGVEKLHARFYVKFAEDAGYTHHFVAVGGYNPPTNWPQGGAGERPRGDDRIYIGIEPNGNYGRVPPPGAWSFYNYWQDMKISADGKYWGNAISPEAPLQVPRGRWQCVEIMAKLNSAPDKADGELVLWLDGNEVMHIQKGTSRAPWSGMGFKLPAQGGEPFEGFRWRNTDALKLNFFWLLDYITEHAARSNSPAVQNPIHRVWFDDIVVATDYIGPIQPKPH